jgi:hypothetical protein
MKIELELKIKEDEEEKDNDSSNISFLPTLTNKEKHEVLFSAESSSLYSSTRFEASYEYDYEVNLIRFGEEKEQEYMYIKTSSKILGDKYIKIDPEVNLYDTLNFPYSGDDKILNNQGETKLAKANIFKRLVSKKKRRLQTEYFDLDMAYITERVIGMGFPATGCETFYRNNLLDLKAFLDRYHGEYKIYNLCIEKKRIYPKDFWIDRKVGLFPFNDHAPCPIKLILDFCVDLCLYLTVNPRGVAAIHCKAGKGRTGVMIVCYLIFSGLCQNTDEALAHYAKQRTLNNKGVTIPSQIRYIKYFETFLSANYERPFLKCIPKIIKFDLNKGYSNMIMNYNTDMSYFTTINSFKLKRCLIGPFSEEMNLQYDFSAITRKKLSFENSKITRKIIDQSYYYEIELCSDDIINYDLKITIQGKKLKFYSWFNLWFNTFEIISKYILKNNYFETEEKIDTDLNRALSQVEMKNGQMRAKKVDTSGFLSSVIQKQYMKGIGRKKLSKAFSKIIAKYTKGKKKKSAIKTLKNNKDLNNILGNIDDLAKEKGVQLLDRENLEFTIERKQLDKLKTKIKDNFTVKFSYQLLQ